VRDEQNLRSNANVNVSVAAWSKVESFIIPLLDARSNLCCFSEVPVKRAVARDVAIQMLRRLY